MPVVIGSVWALDLQHALSHFGTRPAHVGVSSRAAIREMGRFPVPRDPERRGTPAPVRAVPDFRARRFA